MKALFEINVHNKVVCTKLTSYLCVISIRQLEQLLWRTRAGNSTYSQEGIISSTQLNKVHENK